MRVVVLGAGRVGTAVAVLLQRAGHQIAAVSGRDATPARVGAWLPDVPVLPVAEAAALGDLLIVAVPDDALAQTAGEAAGVDLSGRWIVHLSGAHGLSVLRPAVASGARALAIHPLQTFPTVERAVQELPGAPVAVTAEDDEGAALGEDLARDLGAHPFRLADQDRPLYHAAAVFASNYVVAVSGIAAGLFASAGVPDPVAAMHPLQAATIENVARLGPQDALTGPAVRGDAGTIARHLDAIAVTAPDLVPPYVALCRAALSLAGARLDEDRRAAVEEVLSRWT
jgi:predicted short-subunit dehydrogenase-like oxidoreductase (DUF2520 family)